MWRSAAAALLPSALGCSAEVADLHPLGSVVMGLDLRQLSPDCRGYLQELAARRGVLIFRRLATLTAAELLRISERFGGKEVVSRHVWHPESPDEGILRLSNKEARGVVGVGPQWHHDGSTESHPFSHLLFHAQRMPETGGETDFADLASAYDALPRDVQERWARLASVNAYSGAVHPLVHQHPVSGRKVLFLHLGQTGALVAWPSRDADRHRAENEVLTAMAPGTKLPGGLTSLPEAEVAEIFRMYEALLSRPEHSLKYKYEEGDLLVVDNLAMAHRAAASGHEVGRGTRILHRTTVRGAVDLGPPAESGLPAFLYIFGENPLSDAGLWQPADYFGVGFRWNSSLRFHN